MDAHISDRWEPFVRSQVESGRYASAEAMVDEALHLLSERDREQGGPDHAEDPEPAWRRVLQNMQEVPDEVFDRIPADGSAQLDHYLHGTPKRPPSR